MARLCYIVAIIMLSLASASAACTSPFIPIKGSCFYFHETYMTWNDARDYCLSLSTGEYYSDLAVVHSCDQLGAIWQHITLQYGLRWHWVGGNDIVTEGSWHWVTGDTVPLGIPYWYPGNPLVDETRNCVALQSASGYLVDWFCEREGPFVCEETTQPLATLDLV